VNGCLASVKNCVGREALPGARATEGENPTQMELKLRWIWRRNTSATAKRGSVRGADEVAATLPEAAMS
jgi:hypothetical protein